MTKDEFKSLVKVLKAVYSDPKFIADQYAFDAWYVLLEDLPFADAAKAAKSYMQTSSFVPTPADIRKRAARNLTPPPMQGIEAWNLVARALRNSTYGADEEFERLPALVQEAVGSPAQLREWGAEDSTKVHTVEQSHFIRAYEAILQRHKEDAPLPDNITAAIASRDTEAAELRDKRAREAAEALELKDTPEIEESETRATPDQINEHMTRFYAAMRNKMA